MNKQSQYQEIRERLNSLLSGERDEIATMSTVVCELFQAFEHFHWVGFYRIVSPGLLKVGPYQGAHGCLTIAFDRGVCGKCAREEVTQLVPDVNALSYHIACSSLTRSEIVVPVFDASGVVRAVLDVDSSQPAVFDRVDQRELEAICGKLRKVNWLQMPT